MNENNIQAPQKHEKKKRKFNLIDALLILLVLAIIAAIVYVFLPMSAIKNLIVGDKVSIQYTIEIIGVDEQYLEYITENATVRDSVSKSPIGTVIAVDMSTPYTHLTLTEGNEGNQVGAVSTIPGKRNVKVTINAEASFSEGEGYTVNGTRIAVGEKINATFPQYVCESYCISIPRD